MTTAQDLAQDAVEKIGVYAAGETINANDGARVLGVLNNMLDSWSIENLACYAILEQSVVLTIGKLTYTIGTSGGADINLQRPTKLISGPGAAYVVDPTNNRYQVNVIQQDEYNRIWNLQDTNSSWPTDLFYDPQFPLGVLKVYPSPNQGGMTLFWDSYLALTGFASLSASFSFPPGYQLAIVDCLAERIWRYFKPANLAIPQDIVRDAMRAKGNIRRINNRENLMVLDRALSGGGAAYNPYSDSTARR